MSEGTRGASTAIDHGSLDRLHQAQQANWAQERNLREALRALSKHLREHPRLTLSELTIGLTSTPPPPVRSTSVGRHVPQWGVCDGRFRCASVLEVIDWCGSASVPYALTLYLTAEGVADLKLVADIAGEHYTVVTPAAWLAARWNLQPEEKRTVRMESLMVELEARARTMNRMATS